MDCERFDALARMLATKGSRRGALSTILGVVLFGQDPKEGGAKPGKAKRKGSDKGRGKDHGKGNGRGRNDDARDARSEGRVDRAKRTANDRHKGRDRRKSKRKHRKPQAAKPVQAEAACYPGSPCIPGPGKNLGRCDFGGSSALRGKNLKGANLGGANLANANASGANLQGANLDKACLVGADLTGALVNGSTNISSAVLCRTTMPDGSVSNAGCDKGTTCCPTCGAGQPCPGGQLCCAGRCRAGDCCAAGDCPARQCQTASCTKNACRYTPVADSPGPLCDTTCCDGVCCPADTSCVDGACTCDETSCLGCCDGQTCVPVDQQSDAQCGVLGAICRACQQGQACQNGGCICDTETCTGCCATPRGACVLPSQQSSSQCGANADDCVACGANEECVAGDCVCEDGFQPCPGGGCVPDGECCGCTICEICQNGSCVAKCDDETQVCIPATGFCCPDLEVCVGDGTLACCTAPSCCTSDGACIAEGASCGNGQVCCNTVCESFGECLTCLNGGVGPVPDVPPTCCALSDIGTGVCVGGLCSSTATLAQCSGGCNNLGDDLFLQCDGQNVACPDCDAVCPTTLTCTTGRCSGALSPPGISNNYCVSINGNAQEEGGDCSGSTIACDVDSIGYCAVPCPDNTCEPACTADAPDCCAAACVDTQTDANNCGSCGKLCGAFESCQGGRCGFCAAGADSCLSAFACGAFTLDCNCWQLSEGRGSVCGAELVDCTLDPCDDEFCMGLNGLESRCIQASGGAEQCRCRSGTACTRPCPPF